MWKFKDTGYPEKAYQNAKLYFAYGSNMSRDQMSARCPNSEYRGIAYLTGWKFLINSRGYANIVHTAIDSDRVWGLLYWIYPDDEGSLDAYEGVPWAYGKHMHLVESPTCEEVGKMGRLREALVYVDEKRMTEGCIKKEYVRRMERAVTEAVESGVPRDYADRVLEICCGRKERRKSELDNIGGGAARRN